MLASLVDAPLADPSFVYEPKYDGIRAIAEIGDIAGVVGGRVSVPGTETRPPVHIWSRLGNEKTGQFPEIAFALEAWARKAKLPAGGIILDGEIVALDADGDPTGFQQLQGRIHLSEEKGVGVGFRTAFIAFDVLREGRTDLRGRPLIERRAVLERLLGGRGAGGRVSVHRTETRPPNPPVPPGNIRLSEMARGDGRALYQRALADGWEGLIAKQAASIYQSGRRTPDWRKLKIVHEQEFVVGGWTEPRHTRSYFGALLLGVYEDNHLQGRPGPLVYAGHTGTGFNERELARVMKLLKPLETKECPFSPRPKTNERPHWVRPTLIAQIKFTEWTADGKLRHPVYLGLRDDKKVEEVVREQLTVHEKRITESSASEPTDLLAALHALEDARRDGELALPDGSRVKVTNLQKIFWPKPKLTKGDLFRYYVEIAPCLLPAVADRPLVMKRFPNGVGAPPFYQHRVDDAPKGVRVEGVKVAEARRQIVGGNLATLLYMTQLAAISQDPWFSRVQSVEYADYVALDLDPPDGMKFARVLEVARWIRDELESLGATGVPKTSGADGLHVYIPLPPRTPYDAGLLFCQIIATVVAQKHPKAATVERSVRARGQRVYIDYLQNILGKTLATVYSARASSHAGVSTPLTWDDVDQGVRREDFTIATIPQRVKDVGDLWAALRTSKGADLSRVSRYSEGSGKGRLKGGKAAGR